MLFAKIEARLVQINPTTLPILVSGSLGVLEELIEREFRKSSSLPLAEWIYLCLDLPHFFS